MSFSSVSFTSINQASLNDLIDASVPESSYLDYKAQLWGNKDQDKLEFLADVSAMANTFGGDLVIGLEEKAGIPTKICALKGDADQEILRLESILRSSLHPRIPDIQIKAITIDSGGFIIIIRIPRSFLAPHRIEFQGKHKFWMRSAAGKYEPSVEELRTSFNTFPTMEKQIRDFVEERRRILLSQETFPLPSQGCIVLHLVPFSAFGQRKLLKLEKVLAREMQDKLAPISSSARSPTTNLDGAVFTFLDRTGKAQERTIVFRSGIIEAIFKLPIITLHGGYQFISANYLVKTVIDHVWPYTQGLDECGIEPPFVLYVSLIGVSGQDIGDSDPATNKSRIDRFALNFEEVFINQVLQGREATSEALRPFIDQVANVIGLPSADQWWFQESH